MATPNLPHKGLTFPAIAALGLAIFGALKYKKAQDAKAAQPDAADIDVGATPAI